MKYLDKDGLTYFWGKLKGWVNSSAHPVGTIYMTASSTFNPNTAWGGTWTKWADGRVPLAANSTYPLGSTGGANTHLLTESELPSHEHTAGKMFTWQLKNYGINSSALNKDATDQFLWINKSSSSASDYLHTNKTGGSTAFSVMQPYKAVHIWQRTA